jgi:hypothetical protein
MKYHQKRMERYADEDRGLCIRTTQAFGCLSWSAAFLRVLVKWLARWLLRRVARPLTLFRQVARPLTLLFEVKRVLIFCTAAAPAAPAGSGAET